VAAADGYEAGFVVTKNMSPIPEIKRFVLRALNRTEGLPMPDDTLDDAVRRAVVPVPLKSDIQQAKHELEESDFIQGKKDELDGQVTWSLTGKGQHKAAQLG
jgi:hypothetical protein